MPAKRNLALIYGAAFLRSLGIGLIGVILGVYLFRIGLTSLQIGLVIGAGLAGAALGLFIISRYGDRFGRRRTLFALSILAGLAGVGLALAGTFAMLLPLAFFCMLNGMGTDRTAAFALEQAVIPELANETRRTWVLSWYNLVLDIGHAVGAVCAGIPLALQHWMHGGFLPAYKLIFIGYGLLNFFSGILYLLVTSQVELTRPSNLARVPPRLLPQSRAMIRKLAALASIDSFGGGFLTDAIIAYWFFRRFGVQEQSLGLLFFAVHILNAASYPAAAWLARRFGLLKTMVFTHLPSSVFLLAVPFAPSFKLAACLFLVREALVEMDVPTRQSYLAAVVQPGERTFASGVTNLTRNVSWAGASSVTGLLMQYLGLSAPLFFGGSLKITYDLLLYFAFRRVEPPEERRARVARSRMTERSISTQSP
jgi:MFS family permease